MQKQRDKWIKMYPENIDPNCDIFGINCNEFNICIEEDNVLFITCHNTYKLKIYELNREQCNKLYSMIKVKVDSKKSFRLPPIKNAWIDIITSCDEDVETLSLDDDTFIDF